MADLDRAARVGVTLARSAHGTHDVRYQAAWDGALDALLDVPDGAQPPTEKDLALTAARAVSSASAIERHHHGLTVRGAGAPRHAVYWRDLTAPTPSPEARVVNRIAIAQILPRLTDLDRQAVAALAAADDYAAAAALLGITYNTFTVRISAARRRFLRLWHEHENGKPRTIWRPDRRRRVHGLWETPHRLTVLRRAARTTSAEHGTWTRYCRGCTCGPCKAAGRERNSANRQGRAGRPPRQPRPLPEHGTTARRKRGCDCAPCKAAMAAYHRAYRARRAAS
jgi:ribosomal protein L13E